MECVSDDEVDYVVCTGMDVLGNTILLEDEVYDTIRKGASFRLEERQRLIAMS